jgi:hypothetical protein
MTFILLSNVIRILLEKKNNFSKIRIPYQWPATIGFGRITQQDLYTLKIAILPIKEAHSLELRWCHSNGVELCYDAI